MMTTATTQTVVPEAGEHYLNIKGVQERLGVRQTKAYEFVNNHGLWVKIEGIGRRVRLSDLLEAVEEHTTTS